MPRPRCCRRIEGEPPCKVFKPAGQPMALLEEVALSLEEYEAIRLADHEGLYQEEAARRMGVSRQTFGRAVAQARAKVARALVQGLVLRIEVSPAEAALLPKERDFLCRACGHAWAEPFGTGRPKGCPACGANDFHRHGCAGNDSPCGRDPQP